MDDEKIKKNIIKILIVFSTAFLLLILYLSYFEITYGETLISDSNNRRNKDREYEVLRGNIYDRERNLVAESVRQDDGTQTRAYRKGYEMPYAPVLGYYSSKYGTSGLEKSYARDLLDADMLNPFKIVRDIMTSAEKKGNSLVLTIDSDLEKAAYNALGDYRGAVVGLNPKTGEVLCMVSKPVFNPVTIDKDWDVVSKQNEMGLFLNRAIQPGLYPPGSTFKVIVASEAIENIKDVQSKTYKCEGNLKIGNYTLSDFGNESHGSINLHDAFVESCNITFGQIGIELGLDRLKKGAEDFYFNKPIDFDLQVAQSEFPALDKSRKDSLAQSSIGQHEVMVTPLQMALVASTIANKGTMMKPYLIKSIADSYGWDIKITSPEIMAQPIKPETADIVKQMMVDVVKMGTGKSAKINNVEVAGKTGTAEVNEKDAPHSWFIGFAPADDPQIAIAVIVENGETGGGKAAAISREILKLYLNK